MSNSGNNNNGTASNGGSSNEGAMSRKRHLVEAYEDAKRAMWKLEEAIRWIKDDGDHEAPKIIAGVPEVERLSEFMGDVRAVDVSADGKMVIVASGRGIWIIDREHYTVKPIKVDGNLIYALKFIPGKPLAVAAVGITLMLVNLIKGEPLSYLGPNNRQVLDIAMSRDGRTAITGQINGRVTSWDLTDMKENWSRIVFAGETQALAITDDEQHVWCGSLLSTMYKLSMKTGEVCQHVPLSGAVFSLAAVPGTNDIIVGHFSEFEIFDSSQNKIVNCKESYVGMNTCLTKSGDIMLATKGNLIHAICMKPPRTTAAVYSGHTGEVTSIVIMPDDEHFVSGSSDGTVRLWKLPKRADKV